MDRFGSETAERVDASEESLRESAARLRLALDVAELGTWTLSLIDGTGTLDERAARIVGLPAGHLADVARAQQASIHPDDIRGVRVAATAGNASGEPFDLAYRVVHPDGSVHHVASRALALKDESGQLVRLVGTNRDVTAERHAAAERERLLADTEAARASADLERGRMEALLQHLPVGVTLAEAPSGTLLVSNEAVRHIWGLDTPAGQVADYSALYIGYHVQGQRAGRLGH